MQITRIKPGGWIIILLVLAGIIFGIRSCGRFVGGRPAADAGGGNFTGGTAGSLSASQAASGDIIVLTTGTKQKWLQAEIDKFNGQSQGGKATLQIEESRTSMQDIMAGKFQPTIWSPSSPLWMYRLADIWPQAHSGAKIADVTDSQSYRTLFKSPLVFLTTKKKAVFLRPLLSGSSPWEAVRQLSVGQRKAPWGAFHFAYADPLNASSGTLTMSLIITEFAREHGGTENLSITAAQPAFATYLRQINRAYVRDKNAFGSSKLEAAYTSDPSSRDFITAYESAALAAVERDPNFVMIYPSPTTNADQQAWLLSAPWVTDSQKTTATAFLNFIAKSEAIDDGVQYYFRPQSGGQALAARLGPNARAQFQSSPITVDLPPYDALNEGASQWNDMMK